MVLALGVAFYLGVKVLELVQSAELCASQELSVIFQNGCHVKLNGGLGVLASRVFAEISF